jgi:hypothetical protein
MKIDKHRASLLRHWCNQASSQYGVEYALVRETLWKNISAGMGDMSAMIATRQELQKIVHDRKLAKLLSLLLCQGEKE